MRALPFFPRFLRNICLFLRWCHFTTTNTVHFTFPFVCCFFSFINGTFNDNNIPY